MSTAFGVRPSLNSKFFPAVVNRPIVRFVPPPAVIDREAMLAEIRAEFEQWKRHAVTEAYFVGYQAGERDGRAIALAITQLPRTRPEAIMAKVCRSFGITFAELTGRNRSLRFVEARQFCSVVMRKELGMSLPEIGRKLNRDHTTILHLLRRAEGFKKKRHGNSVRYRSET